MATTMALGTFIIIFFVSQFPELPADHPTPQRPQHKIVGGYGLYSFVYDPRLAFPLERKKHKNKK